MTGDMSLLPMTDIQEDIPCVLQDANPIIYEDLAQELEDFIYLSRLGCRDEASKLYDAALKPYCYNHFPIILEYLEVRVTWPAALPHMLLAEDLDVIEDMCISKLPKKFVGQEERAMIQLYRGFCSALRQDFREPPSSNFSISVLLTTLENLVVGISEDQFNPTLWHLHELVLRTHLQTRKLSFDDRRLLYPFYQRCCIALHRISQTWQAFQLLDVTIGDMPSGKALCTYRTLFKVITEDYSKSIAELDQPVKLAYLNGLVHYIVSLKRHEALDDLLHGTTMQPQYCKTQADQLFEYFFHDLANAQGELFEMFQDSCELEDSDSEAESDISATISSNPALLYQQDRRTDDEDHHKVSDVEETEHHDEEKDSKSTDNIEVLGIDEVEDSADEGDKDVFYEAQATQNSNEMSDAASVSGAKDVSNSGTLDDPRIVEEIRNVQNTSETKNEEHHIELENPHVVPEAHDAPVVEHSTDSGYATVGDTELNRIGDYTQSPLAERENLGEQYDDHHVAVESAPDTEGSESSKVWTEVSKSVSLHIFSTTVVMENVISPAILDDFGLAWEFTQQLGELRIIEPISEVERDALASYTKNLQDRRALQAALDKFTKRKEIRERSRLNEANTVNQQREPANSFPRPTSYTTANGYTQYPYSAFPPHLHPQPNLMYPPYQPSYPYAPPSYQPTTSYPPPYTSTYHSQPAYHHYHPSTILAADQTANHETQPYAEESSRANPTEHLSTKVSRARPTVRHQDTVLNTGGDTIPAGESKLPYHNRSTWSLPRLRSGSDTRDRSHSVDFVQRMVEKEVPILRKARPVQNSNRKHKGKGKINEDDGSQIWNKEASSDTVVINLAKR